MSERSRNPLTGLEASLGAALAMALIPAKSSTEVETPLQTPGATLVQPSVWVTVLLAVTSSVSYFLGYFLRFPIFMLGDDILEAPFATIFGTTITTHAAMSLVFELGFLLAKFPGMRVMSSKMYFEHRFIMLAMLYLSTGLVIALPVAISNGNPIATTLGVFAGVFPSAWIYGGLMAYFEGRCATETILAVNTVSFIFAGSASRGTAQAVITANVLDECWVPLLISCVVLGPIVLLTWALDQSPPPNDMDIAARKPRMAMTAADRKEFFMGFAPGLVLVMLVYAMITALREFRDLFTQEIFTAANGGEEPSPFFFFIVDFPGALLAGVMLALFPYVNNSSYALQTMLALMAVFLVLSLLVTLLYQGEIIGGQAWQLLLGTSLYGAYSFAGSSAIFDRIVACSSMRAATCTFLIFAADMSGHALTFAVLMWKTFGAGQQGDSTYLNTFLAMLWAGCAAMILCLGGCLLYFNRRLKGFVP